MKEIRCRYCNIKFTPKHGNTKYCSDECRREGTRKLWRDNHIKHREKINKRSKAWRLSHPEEVKETNEIYYEEHREEILEQKKEYYQKNKEEICRKAREKHHKQKEEQEIREGRQTTLILI